MESKIEYVKAAFVKVMLQNMEIQLDPLDTSWTNKTMTDLGLDSLDEILVALALEVELDVFIPDNEWLSRQTVQDRLNYLCTLIEE